MADDLLLNVTLKLNKDTGQLEVFKQELGAAEAATAKAATGVDKFGKSAQVAMGILAAAGVYKFLSDCVDQAEKAENALKILQFQVQASGVSWNDNKAQIDSWTASLMANTRFTREQAVTSLGELVRITGDVTQAQKLAKLAMDINVATGKDLNDTVGKLGLAYEGGARGLMMLKREFGAQVQDAKDATAALNDLANIYDRASEKENSFAKKQAMVNKHFEELKERIGRDLIKPLELFATLLEKIFGKEDPSLSPAAQELKQTNDLITAYERALVIKEKLKELDVNDVSDRGGAGLQRELRDLETKKGVNAAVLGDEVKYRQTLLQLLKEQQALLVAAGVEQKKNVEISNAPLKAKPGKEQSDAEEAKAHEKLLKDEYDLDKNNLSLGMQLIDAHKDYVIAADKEETAASVAAGADKTEADRKHNAFSVSAEGAAAKQKVDLFLKSAKQYVDIEKDVGQIIDGLATGSADTQKYLIADILEAETLSNSKELAMMAIKFALLGDFGRAGVAAAEAVALGVAASAIHANTEKQKADDKAAADAAKTRDDFAKTTLAGQLADIDKQAKAYRDAGVSQVEVDKWVADQKAQANASAASAAASAANISVSSTNASTSSQVTRTQEVVTINLGGVVVNVDSLNAQTDDIDKLCRDIAEKVRAASLDGIRMAMVLYNAGKNNSGNAV